MDINCFITFRKVCVCVIKKKALLCFHLTKVNEKSSTVILGWLPFRLLILPKPWGLNGNFEERSDPCPWP